MLCLQRPREPARLLSGAVEDYRARRERDRGLTQPERAGTSPMREFPHLARSGGRMVEPASARVVQPRSRPGTTSVPVRCRAGYDGSGDGAVRDRVGVRAVRGGRRAIRPETRGPRPRGLAGRHRRSAAQHSRDTAARAAAAARRQCPGSRREGSRRERGPRRGSGNGPRGDIGATPKPVAQDGGGIRTES